MRRPVVLHWFALAMALVIPPPAGSSVSAAETASTDGPLSLAQLERMALQDNPALAEAAAEVNAAEGLRRQAGLLPNPVLGYRGDELTRNRELFRRQTVHVFYLEQPILLGGKLKKSRAIFGEAKAESEADAETARQGVLNQVRRRFYDVLLADRLIEVRTQLSALTGEAATVAERLLNVGQADRPDVLQAQIEAHRAELDLKAAQQERRAAWNRLAAAVGQPGLPPRPLVGNADEGLPVLDEAAALEAVLRDSPQIKAARARVRREQAEVVRARADRFPDISLSGGLGYNYDRSHGLGGWIGAAELSFPLPLFNRSQGAVAASTARAQQADALTRRLEMDLRERYATAFRSYAVARAAVEAYRDEILPRARESYELYLARFREMRAAYPQVLVAQRTLFQSQAEYLHALDESWDTALLIQGLLIGSDPEDRDGEVMAEWDGRGTTAGGGR